MRIVTYSYRYAQEILEHPNYSAARDELGLVVSQTPLFVYPNKSRSNPRLDVLQQLLNVYYERRFSVDLGWEFHPLATRIATSGLAADFRKTFGDLVVQMEVQFGNMSRWYSDIFKFQTAYSQGLVKLGVCVVPMAALARRIDSNVVNFERVVRELPSAELSITLPILVLGIEPDATTPRADASLCSFASLREITGEGNTANRWRIVNGFLSGVPAADIGPTSPIGATIMAALEPGAEDDATEGV
jgi:hypothetical protein